VVRNIVMNMSVYVCLYVCIPQKIRLNFNKFSFVWPLPSAVTLASSGGKDFGVGFDASDTRSSSNQHCQITEDNKVAEVDY